jgi:phosphoribosyl 1,2-cyclic phosphodiesterase
VEVLILASGSSGNAAVVRSGSTAVLVDAGISALAVRRRLECFGLTLADLAGVLVTHEHSDHVKGLEVLLRRQSLPVWATAGTSARLRVNGGAGGELRSGRELVVGHLRIHPVQTCHDAADPVAFVFEDGEHRLGFCTDTGVATPLLRHRLRDCHALLLEANHDTDLLRHGPYPWPLKQRIRSRLGHLSNEQSAEIASELAWKGLAVLLGLHLSEQNNDPALVRETLRAAAPEGALVDAVPRNAMLRLGLRGGAATAEPLAPPPSRRTR